MSMVPRRTWLRKPCPPIPLLRKTRIITSNMGLTAEAVASKYHVSRRRSGSIPPYQSHQKAINAIKNGYFKEGILPLNVEEIYVDEKGRRQKRNFVMDTDEGPRADTSLEALAKLKPVFAAGGCITAGNSSQTSDGAAFVIVMGENMMKELGLKPMARLVACASAGVHPRIMGIGPVEAVPRALRQAGMNLGQIDLVELNEAFRLPGPGRYPYPANRPLHCQYQWGEPSLWATLWAAPAAS